MLFLISLFVTAGFALNPENEIAPEPTTSIESTNTLLSMWMLSKLEHYLPPLA